ncbi:hypothetical protein RvY_08423 [Ramazzottius varieornatus]|uniref:Arginine-glutamic acid dipeptide repeats protein n=1 Tax=Ramazzottius varieornatus TaxID=947166 RepID=A0A1D1V5T3_RAMVA|nr:hypothetical protein RvY_08423 [Ramazzottius varieornatus]
MQRDLPEMLRDYCSSSCDSNFEPGANGKATSENCSLNRQQTSAEVSYMSSRLSNGVYCQTNSVVLSTKSTSLTEPTREDVSCVVRGKERLLGYAYLKNEIYVEYVCADGTSYKPGDSVYMERGSRRDTFETFNICTIQDFFRNKRDNCLYARVKGFHRLNEIPASWYPYFQDRNNIAAAAAAAAPAPAHSGAEVPAKDPAISNRELVFSDTYDAYPVSALRGVSNVRHYRDHLSAKAFEASDDCFYYIFWKNSYGSVKDKELASTQGEIRVGSNYQARLPPCQPPMSEDERKDTKSNPEWSKWVPKKFNGDLNMFITAARSMHAYRTICSSGIIDDGDLKMTVYKDECTQKALDALHQKDYKLEDALHELMKNPDVQCNPASKWTDDEAQRFVRGIRKHGKNFFKIQKEFLPARGTAKCIEYFYLWKKTAAGLKVLRRPAAGSQKRTSGGGLRRIKTRGPNRTLSSDFVDCSPSSGDEERESDDSDKDLSAYQCSNCSATESKEWHHTTKDKTTVLCSDCRLFYKKYGELRPTEERENNAPSASGDKATASDENNENVLSEKTGPTTRRAVGRPKSACAVTSPESTDKNRRSPGSVSSSSVESKKKAKTSKVKSEKDATSPTPAPSTTTETSQATTSVIETKTSSTDMDVDIPPEPTSIPSSQQKPPVHPDVKPSSPTTGIQKNMSALDVHPHSSSGLQVKTEPMDTSIDSFSDRFFGTDRKTEQEKSMKSEGSEEGSSRSSSQQQHMPPALRENSPEPKPEHAQCFPKAEYSLIKVWHRNENSCARTDLIFKAHANSKLSAALQARLTDQASSKPSLTPNKDASSSSSSSKTSKSPAPGKDEKRPVPVTAGRQSTGPAGAPSSERDRDNRSTGAVGGRTGDTPSRLSFPPAGIPTPVQRQLSGSVIPGLSPDLGLPPGHPGVNPFAAAAAAAASVNAAQMPPGMFGANPAAERMRMMESLDRERMLQAARAGVPGAAAMMQQLSPEMQMMESLRQREMMANLYPHLAGPQVAAVMAAEAQQQQQAAQQQQRDLMALAAAGMLPGHPGGLHPALQQEMANREQAALYQQMAMAAQAQAAGPFGAAHFPRGPNPGDMMHMLGRQPSIEDHMMMAQLQHNHHQRVQEEQAQQHQLQQLFRSYGQSGMPNPDFMRN